MFKTLGVALVAVGLSVSVGHAAKFSGVYDSVAEHPSLDTSADRAALDFFNDKKSIFWSGPGVGCDFSSKPKRVGKKYIYKGRCGYSGAHGTDGTLEVTPINGATIKVVIKSIGSECGRHEIIENETYNLEAD